jgi:pantoate--beta-alanine ligase
VQIVRNSEELARARAAIKGTLAFIPTMGALHAGHMALVDEGKKRADKVAASIFVNPTQFNDKNDLVRYPRQEEEDALSLEEAGCDLLWAPAVDDIYPEHFATSIHVSGVSDRWEGEHRPGHFDGVATVVAKLFIAIRPDVAIFGEKDFQQLAVIRRATADLGLPVGIIGVPTVRESDGLAMSSRNSLLSPAERERAPTLFRLLAQLAKVIASDAPVSPAVEQMVQDLKQDGFDSVDYVAYVDGETLEPLTQFREGGRLLAAAFLGSVRLIDNIAVGKRG